LHATNKGFVWVGKDSNFMKTESVSLFKGVVNYWQAMNLGAQNTGHRIHLINDLNKMKSFNIHNLRIIAALEGPETIQKL